MRRSPLLLLALTAVAAGCLPALPRVEGSPQPEFDPTRFFEGRTEGLGTLTVRGSRPVLVRVESVGDYLPDGAFRLRQLVRRGDAAPAERVWVLRFLGGPNTHTGTLTEGGATRDVRTVWEGDRLRIAYRMGPLTSVRQELTLQPGGGVALNLMTVRVLGVPIARLTEQISRLD